MNEIYEDSEEMRERDIEIGFNYCKDDEKLEVNQKLKRYSQIFLEF